MYSGTYFRTQLAAAGGSGALERPGCLRLHLFGYNRFESSGLSQSGHWFDNDTSIAVFQYEQRQSTNFHCGDEGSANQNNSSGHGEYVDDIFNG